MSEDSTADNLHEFPDLDAVKARKESFYAQIDYRTSEGRQWARGWTVPGTVPGTDIPTLDVFWSDNGGRRRRQLIKVDRIDDVEVREVTDD